LAILTDTSPWLDLLRGVETPATGLLRRLILTRRVGIPDLVVMEILQGTRDRVHFNRLLQDLLKFQVHPVGRFATMVRAAENYQFLRSRGVTIRSSIDCLIATYCIEGGHQLVHSDRDYDAFEKHLGLLVARA
jgi:hypothetical protein